jgi:hypothetical protein
MTTHAVLTKRVLKQGIAAGSLLNTYRRQQARAENDLQTQSKAH